MYYRLNNEAAITDAVERVRTFIISSINSIGEGKRGPLSQNCSWLCTQLDEFTKIAFDISRKLETVEMAETITSTNVDFCIQQEIGELFYATYNLFIAINH